MKYVKRILKDFIYTQYQSILHQRFSEPEFYGGLVYKLTKIFGTNNFSAQFIKTSSHYKNIGFNIKVKQQTTCFVVNPITVDTFAYLFKGTSVG